MNIQNNESEYRTECCDATMADVADTFDYKSRLKEANRLIKELNNIQHQGNFDALKIRKFILERYRCKNTSYMPLINLRNLKYTFQNKPELFK